LAFKYKFSSSADVASSNNLQIVGDKEKNLNSLDIENRKKSKDKRRKVSSYFYQVSDHPNLTKIGGSYYEDVSKGLKSFAISSTGYLESQQKTILALASFFDHKEQYKILIVSNNLEHGLYKDFIDDSSLNIVREGGEVDPEISIYRFHEHFDFISFYSLFLFSHEDGPDASFEKGVNDILNTYDVIFWDIPTLGEVQNKSKFFFPLMAKFDSMTIIVAKNLSQYSELEEVKTFFNNYGVNLKGLLIDTSNLIIKEEDKKT